MPRPAPHARQELVALLEQAGRALRGSGPEDTTARQRITALRDRLEEGRFHLAVLGQFKRGKSTLINALLGEEVLPSAAVPVTAIPTFVAHGRRAQVTISYTGGQRPDVIPVDAESGIRPVLERYVTEASNPGNRRGVERVDVAWPSPVLADGVVLIDTPGIGSTHRHNTASTMRLLAECDAALFVLSADPPVTEVESRFLERVREVVEHVFFVLNKADLLDDPERHAVLAFCERVLVDESDRAEAAHLHPVSARAALAARQRGDRQGWTDSGLATVQEHLVDYLAREKREALQRAVASKAAVLLDEAASRLELEVRSLELPLSELEQRVRTLEEELRSVRRDRMVAADLLQGDRRRLVDVLGRQAAAVRRTARAQLVSVVDEACGAGAHVPDARALDEAIAARVREIFDTELAATARSFEDRVAEVMAPHQARAAEVIARVRQAAEEVFDIPAAAASEASPFVLESRPYWSVRRWRPSLSPIPEGALDRFFPAGLRRRRARARAVRKIDALVLTNVEQLRWSTLQNLDLAFRRFGREYDERLAEVVAGTVGAALAIAERRRTRERASSAEIAERRTRLAEVARVASALHSGAPG